MAGLAGDECVAGGDAADEEHSRGDEEQEEVAEDGFTRDFEGDAVAAFQSVGRVNFDEYAASAVVGARGAAGERGGDDFHFGAAFGDGEDCAGLAQGQHPFTTESQRTRRTGGANVHVRQSTLVWRGDGGVDEIAQAAGIERTEEVFAVPECERFEDGRRAGGGVEDDDGQLRVDPPNGQKHFDGVEALHRHVEDEDVGREGGKVVDH